MKPLKNSSGIKAARVIAIVLLTTVGITAMVGGAALVLDPSGQSMDTNIESLAGTMFESYRAPGIILFLALGVMGLSVALLTMGNYTNHPILILYQGIILTGWIMAQLYLLPFTHYLQGVCGIAGIMLMLLGSYLLIKKNHLRILY